MKIAFIGQRGVPATHGGIERYVEEVGARLAARGHDVTVWCRSNYGERQPDALYRGMRLRYVRTIGTKQLDALVPSVMAALRTNGDYEVVHYQAIGPGVATPLSRLRRSLVVQTIHGLDHERAKWGAGAKFLLRQAAWMSGRVPHEVVVVSRSLADHYREVFGREATWIRNGVTAHTPVGPGPALEELGVQPRRYALFVGRLVPEKAPDLLVRAFGTIPDPDVRLVIVGGSSFTDHLVGELHELAERDPRVILAGYRYGDQLVELYSNAGAFCLPSHLEGLPLTLLEAISYGVPVVASDIDPHIEVLETSGAGHRLFPAGDAPALADALQQALAGGADELAGADAMRASVLRRYDWDRTASELEDTYRRGLAKLRG